MRKLAFPGFLVAVAVFLISCGVNSNSSTMSNNANPAMVPVTMSVQDAPPAGVTILSFEIQITSANLQPADTTRPAVALLVKPAEVELEQLQAEPALLGNLNVAAGKYSSVTVAFANPRMTIFNGTASAIMVGTTSCASKSVCMLTPALTNATTTVNTAPFPITLAANSPLGLLLHFDVNSSVSSDLMSITPTVDLKQIAPSTTGVIQQVHLAGTITATSSPDFTLQLGLGALAPTIAASPPVFKIATNGSTIYEFQDDLQATCTTDNFACLAPGQAVQVTANVLADGSLLAAVVTLFEQHDNPAFEGTVVSVDTTNNQFKMALMGGQYSSSAPLAAVTSIAIGVLITVNVTSSTVYEIDTDGFTIPAGLTFHGISDMVAGQSVEIQPSAVSAGPVANTLIASTNRVRLDKSQVTARVASIDNSVTPPTAFTLGSSTLPPLFSPFSAILVETITTPPPTQFQNVSGVSGLTVGDTVSVGGLLFNTSAMPTMVAERVLKRVICAAASASGTTTMIPCALPSQ
jgi:Domain of unknown function (DUF4382)/Domain of unknown function (DUF5666)